MPKASPARAKNPTQLNNQPENVQSIIRHALSLPTVTQRNLRQVMKEACSCAETLYLPTWQEILRRVCCDKKLFSIFLYNLRKRLKGHQDILDVLGICEPITISDDDAIEEHLEDATDTPIEVPYEHTNHSPDDPDDESTYQHYEVLVCTVELFVVRLSLDTQDNPTLRDAVIDAGFYTLNAIK